MDTPYQDGYMILQGIFAIACKDNIICAHMVM